MRALGGPAPAHVLDIGTGHGRDAAILLDHGHRVTGIDIVTSPEWPTVTAGRPDRARVPPTSVTELGGSAGGGAPPARPAGARSLPPPGAERGGSGEYAPPRDNGCLTHQPPDDSPAYLARVR